MFVKNKVKLVLAVHIKKDKIFIGDAHCIVVLLIKVTN